jgi:hypothetical protein
MSLLSIKIFLEYGFTISEHYGDTAARLHNVANSRKNSTIKSALTDRLFQRFKLIKAQ